MDKKTAPSGESRKKPGISSLLKPYKGMIAILLLMALLSNGINLLLPRLIAKGIDGYSLHGILQHSLVIEFCIYATLIFVFTLLQSILQTYASERVAFDLRQKLSDKISRQSALYIQQTNPSKLLTNLTSDVDSIKMFVSQAIVAITSSLIIIIGASILLFMINWQLAIAVVAIVPIIGGTFFFVLSKVRILFKKSREVIDWLNKVINESILGAALIRVVNAQQLEYDKFLAANTDARNYGLSILRLFAGLVPIITFTANMAVLAVLALGGHFVITGSMSLGDFAAFNSYIALLIFPILVIGFMSNIIAQANASYQRIQGVLNTPDTIDSGRITTPIHGEIELKNVTVLYGQKTVLKNISFKLNAGTRTAIIGPTAAGKTQLLYLLTGLIKPDSGSVEIDGKNIDRYNKETFHSQVGFVFQDSIMFNMSLRENIAFSNTVTDDLLEKAINTAELSNFIQTLPQKLDTEVSERGTSLSGGQKQRIMLARALAINPKILLLDDFTARVDASTEQNILQNVRNNYPDLTLLSVTQKIAAIESYDQIMLLMEGELIAQGTHAQLLETCPEYVQIYQSQRSTNHYETV